MAMAVGILNLSVFTVDDELSLLILAHHPAFIHGVLFGISMDACPFSSRLLNIPPTLDAWNNMVLFPCHFCVLTYQKIMQKQAACKRCTSVNPPPTLFAINAYRCITLL